jgi:predicted transcriptional regulator
MSSATVKERAHELLDKLPENATWDDVVYKMVTRREIERGMADSEAGRTTTVDDVAKEFGIAE